MNGKFERILVTGGGGFLGRYVVDELQERGFGEILVPRSADYDLRRESVVDALFRSFRPHAVIHCAAAVGGIGANQAEPGAFFYDNAAMALHLIEASRKAGARFLGIGTTCSYPRSAPLPISEEAYWDGAPDAANAPYGYAKRMMTAQLEAYGRQYGMTGSVIVPANLYGPRDHFDLEKSHVIPGMIRRFISARDDGADEVVLWGDGSPTRDFIHAADAARAIATAAETAKLPPVVNVGSGEEVSIKTLASTVKRLTGYAGEIRWDTTRPNGQPRRVLSTKLAENVLGFAPRISFEEGLAETIDWYESQNQESKAA